MSAISGRLPVPGAVLYYEVRGRGPLLLISQSGEGDAGRSTDLVAHLVDAHTVVTYDRRGLSRSALSESATQSVTLAQHADDAHRLLAHLTDEPASLLGCSLGASIGLHLALRHPEQVGVLVAHEPVTPRLLRAEERSHHEAELREIQEMHRREGLTPTLKAVAKVLGIDLANPNAEADLTPQPMSPQRVRNFDFFIEHDFAAILNDDIDVVRLDNVATTIVPAAGRSTPHTVFDRRCAVALADLLGTALHEFPGGHNGNTTHPRAYAAQLRHVLSSACGTPHETLAEAATKH
jgi:pimeloyl-ACP methyl ester carboxylesterase